MILLDTNLLTRITRAHDPHSAVARAAIQNLVRRGERLIIVPQNLYESGRSPRDRPDRRLTAATASE